MYLNDLFVCVYLNDLFVCMHFNDLFVYMRLNDLFACMCFNVMLKNILIKCRRHHCSEGLQNLGSFLIPSAFGHEKKFIFLRCDLWR